MNPAMQQVSDMVAAMRDAQSAVAATEDELKVRKAALRRIETEALPALLRENDIDDITLTDGTRVQIADDLACSISEARAREAHAWLRINGHGAVIKTQVAVFFGRDKYNEAEACLDALVAQYGDEAVAASEKVHPATLKALLKDLLKAGIDVPQETFGIMPYTIAKLFAPRAKKTGA